MYPGLDPARARQAHTTEQKILGLGQLIDNFLAPWLLNESHWDEHLNLDSDKFVADVRTMPWVKGNLQQVHFCDYLIQAGIMSERTEGGGPPARNSALFLELSGHTSYQTISSRGTTILAVSDHDQLAFWQPKSTFFRHFR